MAAGTEEREREGREGRKGREGRLAGGTCEE
jgi:hypothetical protein